jgi:hypothetical protein
VGFLPYQQILKGPGRFGNGQRVRRRSRRYAPGISPPWRFPWNAFFEHHQG